MYTFIELILYFSIYSFLGWVCETIYCSILDRKLVNRGFLNGPVCPVYGFGALLVISLLNKYRGDIFAIFFLGMIIASVVEYITAVILETSFQTKWWDYSKHKFNIHGRVCLLNSTLFGLLSVMLIEIINVRITTLINSTPKIVNIVLACIVIAIFISDFITTLIAMIKLNDKLNSLIEVIVELKSMNIKLKDLNEKEFEELIRLFKDKEESEYVIDNLTKIYDRYKKLNVKSMLQRRILKAFPNIEHKKYKEQFQNLQEIINNKMKKQNK